MKKSILLLLAIAISYLTFDIEAKTKNNLKRSDAGIRAGAAFGFPAGSIPDGASGLPLPAPSLGLFYSYKFTPKWSVQIGFEAYSMKANFNTHYEYFEYTGDIGKYITVNGEPYLPQGEISTIHLKYAFVDGGRFNNKYIAAPITANYHFTKGWSISFGGYVAYNYKKEMQGTAKNVHIYNPNFPEWEGYPADGNMPFNESDKIKDWDFGMNVGGNYELKNGINFDLRLNAGLTDIFVKEFSAPPSAYHNIVVQTTIGYRLGGTRRI